MVWVYGFEFFTISVVSLFRNIVRRDYFSVLHPLSSPREIKVLPMQNGEGIMGNPNILDDVFEKFVNGVKIFKDREILRHDYFPNKLPHREEQIRLLGAAVAPVLKEARCSNIFIYGKTGTGKTAVTKFVLSHLEAKAKEYGAPVKFCYINCRMVGSEYRVFASLSQSLGLSIPFTGLSVGEVFDRFRAGLDITRVIFIVILDEI